jgi:hypothetical protein
MLVFGDAKYNADTAPNRRLAYTADVVAFAPTLEASAMAASLAES